MNTGTYSNYNNYISTIIKKYMLYTNESQLLILDLTANFQKYLFPVLSKLLTVDKDQHNQSLRTTMEQLC